MIPFAVTALIFSDTGKILSVSRKDDHTDFNLPGGKVDEGETAYDAVVRELEEETGLTLTDLHPFHTRNDKDDNSCTTFIATGTISEDSVVVGLREGEAVVAWKTWEDITSSNSYAKYNRNLRDKVLQS